MLLKFQQPMSERPFFPPYSHNLDSGHVHSPEERRVGGSIIELVCCGCEGDERNVAPSQNCSRSHSCFGTGWAHHPNHPDLHQPLQSTEPRRAAWVISRNFDGLRIERKNQETCVSCVFVRFVRSETDLSRGPGAVLAAIRILDVRFHHESMVIVTPEDVKSHTDGGHPAERTRVANG